MPTRTPRPVATTATLAAATAIPPSAPSPTIPTVPPPTATWTPPPAPLALYPTADWTDDPAWTARLPGFLMQPNVTLIGLSLEGRPIAAQRIGTGERTLLIIAGLHGGWEANTTGLAFALLDHFATTPADLPPGTALIVIPAANPDGTARGATAAGRFNAAGVDLNRNWGCGWQTSAVWRDQPVGAGSSAFSEPESRGLAEYVQALRPVAALSYHSAAAGVFPGDCPIPGAVTGDSDAFGAVVALAAGLSCCGGFSAYPVTGTAAAWIDGQGIAAADIELRTHTALDLDAHIAGVRAALRWVAGR